MNDYNFDPNLNHTSRSPTWTMLDLDDPRAAVAVPAVPQGFLQPQRQCQGQPHQEQQGQGQSGFFDSILYQDQQAFLAELVREQQKQQEMSYHQNQSLPGQGQSQGQLMPEGVKQEEQQEYPQQYQNYPQPTYDLMPPGSTTQVAVVVAETEPEVNSDAEEVYNVDPQCGPKPIISDIDITKNSVMMDPLYSLILARATPQPNLSENGNGFINLRNVISSDPMALECLSPILQRELSGLGELIGVMSIYLPIQQYYPGVYKLLFHIKVEDLLLARFEIGVTDDYPAEAPFLNFEALNISLSAINKLRRRFGKISFSFRVEEIVMEWVKVCFEACKTKMIRDNSW